MGKLMKFMKDWMLVIGMVTGASLYVIYHSVPVLHAAGPALLDFCTHIQPVMLFMMLFLTFCRIEPHDLKPHRWQWWLLLIQGGSFVALALILMLFPGLPARVGVESLMLCMICPTATACSVVTDKLGGSIAGVLTYTTLINLLTAFLVPLFVPLIHPVEGLDFFTAASRILAKVFPLLIMPAVAAWLVRYLMPRFHRWVIRFKDLSFYIWAFALMLAILMSTRAIFQNDGSAMVLLEIAAASLLSCAVQFASGKAVGAYYDRKALCRAEEISLRTSVPAKSVYATSCNRKVTAGQSLGQKNTVFGIWMGYTFFDPVTSLAGGFYSIWHNVYNTWQLRRLAGK
ncbi:MAG: transporter [Bacteroidia bacterium]|nr:transporter [Bacteroidia bacterium]